MNRTETATRVLFLEQLAAEAKAAAAILRNDLFADARAEFEEQGTAPTWRIPISSRSPRRVARSRRSSATATFRAMGGGALSDGGRDDRPPVVAAGVREAGPDPLRRGGFVVSDPETGEVIPGLDARPGGVVQGHLHPPVYIGAEVFTAVASRPCWRSPTAQNVPWSWRWPMRNTGPPRPR